MSINSPNWDEEDNKTYRIHSDSEDDFSIDSTMSLSSETMSERFDKSGDSGLQISNQISTEAMVPPLVSDNHLPKIGNTYMTLTEAIDVYRNYASHAGFQVKLSSQNLYPDKSLRRKYIRCDKYGKAKKKKAPVLDESGVQKQQRNRFSKKTDCQAMMCVVRDFKTNLFSICEFKDLHNHPLCKVSYDAEMKNKKKLNYLDRQFIMKVSTLNIGPTRVYKLRACLKGGYHKIGTSLIAFKNFWRDFVNIIGPNDAQCVVDQLTIRKKSYPNFFFKYKMNGDVLSALFWADEIAKENYSIFSDVISVDGTYRTNRYKMIFVPFTAINNHDKTVNVGAALMSDETIESYTWLLETFLEAHGKAPTMILTDQDAALSHAVKDTLPNSTHRLCMWHIIQKIPGKIADDVHENRDFKKKFNKLVWDMHLNTADFEQQWDLMLSEFNLRENKWLHDMYIIRDKWIPAYFKHIPMCGLMKTTSRSESSNSFFNVFTNTKSLLVNFMFNFDTAVTKQRHEQERLDVVSNSAVCSNVYDTFNKHIEHHAASIYTRAIFLKIQKEMRKALSLCYQKTVVETDEHRIHTIVYKNHKTNLKTEFEVTSTCNNNSTECTCQRFHRFGILCCHIFRVFMDTDVQQIPEQYVLPRWRQNNVHLSRNKDKIQWSVFNSETLQLVEEATSEFEKCLENIVHDKANIRLLIEKLKSFQLDNEAALTPKQQVNEIKQFVEETVGLKIGDSIKIHVPSGITNKGGNRQTRLISAKEKAIAKSQVATRLCKGCNQYVHHDKRNCPVNPSGKFKPIKKICKK